MADRIEMRVDEPVADPGKAPEGATGDHQQVRIPDGQESKGATEEKPERPQWLPEKFESPEAMAEAYRALEKKLSGKKDDPPQQEETPSTPAGLDLAALTAEYEANQGLTDETYAKLQAAGLGRDVVDAVIASRVSQGDDLTRQVYAEAGSQEAYQQMIEWARVNYRPEQAQAFDAALGASADQARMAVRALKADFTSATGSPPKLVGPQATTPSSSGVKPFESQTQVYHAMRDPKYREDPAYRAEVAKRLAVTNF